MKRRLGETQHCGKTSLFYLFIRGKPPAIPKSGSALPWTTKSNIEMEIQHNGGENHSEQAQHRRKDDMQNSQMHGDRAWQDCQGPVPALANCH